MAASLIRCPRCEILLPANETAEHHCQPPVEPPERPYRPPARDSSPRRDIDRQGPRRWSED
jgi:hypothetical protein